MYPGISVSTCAFAWTSSARRSSRSRVDQARRRVTRVQPQIGGDLVVAAAPRVEPPPRVADLLDQPRLDVHVHVLERLVPRELARGELPLDAPQPGRDRGRVLGADDAARARASPRGRSIPPRRAATAADRSPPTHSSSRRSDRARSNRRPLAPLASDTAYLRAVRARPPAVPRATRVRPPAWIRSPASRPPRRPGPGPEVAARECAPELVITDLHRVLQNSPRIFIKRRADKVDDHTTVLGQLLERHQRHHRRRHAAADIRGAEPAPHQARTLGHRSRTDDRRRERAAKRRRSCG